MNPSLMCASVACRRVRAEGSAYCNRHGSSGVPPAYTCIQDGCAALVDDVEFCARHADEWNRAYMPAAEYEAARLDLAEAGDASVGALVEPAASPAPRLPGVGDLVSLRPATGGTAPTSLTGGRPVPRETPDRPGDVRQPHHAGGRPAPEPYRRRRADRPDPRGPYADRDVWDVWDDGGLERPGEDEGW